MILSPTTYPNTSRTITGLINPVFNTDSIILCDTTTGAVALQLADIPQGYWSTQYRLYVIDSSGLANVNNITINAPLGFTINGASSVTINVANGRCILKISSDTTYLASFSYGTSAGNLAILDQGVLLTPTCSSIDFLGANVTATNVGNAVSVNVTNNYVTLTYAQLTILANTNLLAPNTNYLITDAEFGSTPMIPTNVLVTAVTTNKVSLTGQGIFFNADYQAVGNYSGVPTFNMNKGVWDPLAIIVLGDVVIWNNFMYLNITGINTPTNPSADLVNWQVLTYSTTNGYILEIDAIEYQQSTNWIIKRSDLRLNVVERSVPAAINSLNGFAWGSNKIYANSVTNNSCLEIGRANVKIQLSNNVLVGSVVALGDVNQPCLVDMSGNTFTNSRLRVTIENNTFNENIFISSGFNCDSNLGSFEGNYIFHSSITLPTNDGAINYNTIEVSIFQINNNLVLGQVTNNVISNAQFIIGNQNNAQIKYNRILSGSRVSIFNNLGVFGEFLPKGGGNVIEQSSELIIETNNAQIFGNSFSDYTSVNIPTNNSSISANHWNEVIFNLADNSVGIIGNVAYALTLNASTLSMQINGGIGVNGQNSIAYELDLNNPAIYNIFTNTLTIPVGITSFFGFYTLLNAGGVPIDKIANLNGKWATTFVNDAGTTTFNSVAVGGAVADEIISPSGVASFPVVYRLNGQDFISFKLLGTFVGLDQVNIYT